MKWVNNFFTLIDPNFYFFANHPHERGGIAESERFWFGFLPFFILGFLILGQKRWFLSAGLVAAAFASLWGLESGPYLVYPFIILATIRGLMFVVAKLQAYVRP